MVDLSLLEHGGDESEDAPTELYTRRFDDLPPELASLIEPQPPAHDPGLGEVPDTLEVEVAVRQDLGWAPAPELRWRLSGALALVAAVVIGALAVAPL